MYEEKFKVESLKLAVAVSVFSFFHRVTFSSPGEYFKVVESYQSQSSDW